MKKINEVDKFIKGETYKGVGEVSGINFTLLDRYKNNALFSRSDGYYEVIELKQQNARTVNIKGKEVNIKEREVYPSGESWLGKCVNDRVTAQGYFNILCTK